MRKTLAIALLLTLLCLTACNATETSAPTAQAPVVATDTPPATPTPAPTETPEPESGVIKEAVEIEGADGLTMVGTVYHSASDTPQAGVLLLHMLDGNHQVWDKHLGPQLAEDGYTVLAVDMRGHGKTGGAKDWDLTAQDLLAAHTYLSQRADVDPQRTAVVGASIGANMALITGAEEPNIRGVVLLSPGLDYRGVSTTEPMAQYGYRPLQVIASNEDTYAADSAKKLSFLTDGEMDLRLYDGIGHGTNMLTPDTEVAGVVNAWLNANVRDLALGAEAGQTGPVNFNAADGKILNGTLYGSGQTGVILSNMNGGTQEQWDNLPQALADAGYRVLTYNYRGPANTNATLARRLEDARGAINFMSEQDISNLILIGASIGGTTSAELAGTEDIEALAGLVVIGSPVNVGAFAVSDEELAGITVPKLFINTENDHVGTTPSTEQMFEQSAEPKEIYLYPGSAHGTEILASADGPDLTERIINFVAQTVE